MIAQCDRFFRRARLLSSLPTSRGRRGSCTSSGTEEYADAAGRAPACSAGGVRAARRRRGGHAGRRVLRRVPDCPRCTDAARERAGGARAAGADGPPHRHAAADGRRATSASTSTARHGSLPPVTAARCSCRRRPRRSSIPSELRDLGEHRLKDLSAPERIFQLGDGDFPPLKTLYRTNLPIPATPFLGREHELADVRQLLVRDDARLLTLTGAGGSGKTRLALQAAGEAAEAYPDGVWWVPLAPLADPADVGPAAARALGGGGTLPELVDGRRASARARQLRARRRGRDRRWRPYSPNARAPTCS